MGDHESWAWAETCRFRGHVVQATTVPVGLTYTRNSKLVPGLITNTTDMEIVNLA